MGLFHQFPTEIPSEIFDYLTMYTKIPDDSLAEVERTIVKAHSSTTLLADLRWI